MIYRDRIEAATLLARELSKWRAQDPLVLAIPRGAVEMAKIIAGELQGTLDVVLVRKLPAPGNPELAIGAVDEGGQVHLVDHAGRSAVSSGYVDGEVARELATIRRRRALYTPGRAPIDPAGRVVIVVDDGLATGATMTAALNAIRARIPKHLICAVPVASGQSIDKVRAWADEVVCLQEPPFFYAVSQFYRSFPQVDDREVVALLSQTGDVRPVEPRATDSPA